MIIIDNVISVDKQEELKKILLVNNFPWFYQPENTITGEINNTPCHSHFFISNGIVNSPFGGVINILVTGALDNMPKKIISKYSDIKHARAFLQMPLSTDFCKVKVDPLHVDCEFDHYVCLYYVADSDAHTIITKTKYKEGKKISLDYKDHKVLERIKPVQGRMVLFDGNYYHTAEQPTSDTRCVINIDLVKPV